jgi:hypothetical protein
MRSEVGDWSPRLVGDRAVYFAAAPAVWPACEACEQHLDKAGAR